MSAGSELFQPPYDLSFIPRFLGARAVSPKIFLDFTRAKRLIHHCESWQKSWKRFTMQSG